MQVLIFDGSPSGEMMGGRLFSILQRKLADREHTVEYVLLREQHIEPCKGCFGCWLKSPGSCTIDDDGRRLAAAYVRSDLVISLTPVTFGSYSPELKRMYDRLIQNISPFFIRVHGETHHRKRYARYPDIMTIGWLDKPDEDAKRQFMHLVFRNSLNFNAASSTAGVLPAVSSNAVLVGEVEQLIGSIERREMLTTLTLPDRASSATAGAHVRRALLLVGSPRMASSNSMAVGSYLLNRLKEKGIAVEVIQLYQAMRADALWQQLLEAIGNADLVILAFPLYIDTLPADMLLALRRLAVGISPVSGKGLVAIANSGFIESVQSANALGSCALFARQTGFEWRGSIAIGGGEGLIKRIPLDQQQGPVVPLKLALDQMAVALANGGPVPDEARRRIARPFVPAWLFRMVGTMQWKKQAHRHGVSGRLDDRPYLRDQY
jgi:multimeric flavodoxin WrbA